MAFVDVVSGVTLVLSGTERGRRSRRRPFDLLWRTLAATYLLSDQPPIALMCPPPVSELKGLVHISALWKQSLSKGGFRKAGRIFFIFSNLTNRHTFPYFHNHTFIQRRLYCTSMSWSLDGPVGITVRRSNLLFIQVKTLTEALKFIFFWLSN